VDIIAKGGAVMANELELSIHDADVLLPWGILNVDRITAEKGIKVPADWLIGTNRTLQEKIQHFSGWREEILKLINAILWPRYNRDNEKWIGDSSTFMHELTKTDLALLGLLRHPVSGVSRFNRIPSSPLRSLDILAHEMLFEQEDAPGAIFGTFPAYDRTADTATATAIATLCARADFEKQDPVNFYFKNHLQRPRPMQMALRFGFLDFEYENAASSITPSMCSGHCLQGVLDVSGAIERLLQDFRGQMTVDKLTALGQWGVDIGDRRVLAGVHYPSDNVCSWLIFLRMADFVFVQPNVKLIMGYAIQNLSYVFQQLQQWMKDGEGKVYGPALAELDRHLPPSGFTLHDVL
jgi:hypothetical protein